MVCFVDIFLPTTIAARVGEASAPLSNMATAMSLGSASSSENTADDMTSSLDEESSRLEAMSLSEPVGTAHLSPAESEVPKMCDRPK